MMSETNWARRFSTKRGDASKHGDLSMDRIRMPEEINHHRRRFFGIAAMTIAAGQLGMTGFAEAQPSRTKSTQLPTVKPGTNTSFAALKQIDAGLLKVGYAEAGAA